MEDRDKQEVSCNIDAAGDGNEDQRSFAVAQPAKDIGQHIVGDDKYNSPAADAYVLNGDIQCGRRSLHEPGNGPGQRDHESSKYGGDNGKKCNGVAEQSTDLVFLFFTETASDEDGNRCGHGGGDKGHHIEKRAAGGDAGDADAAAEAADYQKIDGTVHGLEDQCTERRQHKLDELLKNIALCKISCTFHNNIYNTQIRTDEKKKSAHRCADFKEAQP